VGAKIAGRILTAKEKAMALFAEYRPGRQRRRPAVLSLELQARPAKALDLEALVLIAAEREGPSQTEARQALQSCFAQASESGLPLLWVAQWQGEVLGFAKLRHLQWSTDTPEADLRNLAPPGWYLDGVIVAPRYRRLGVGKALTQARLNWLRAQACKTIYYWVEAQNLASIDLHKAFGFAEISRDFVFPGVPFAGGQGILFKVDLPPEPVYHPSVAALWQEYLASLGESPALTAKTYSAWHFCDNPTDADHLAELVKSGIKRATTSLYHWYQHGGEPLPKEGEYSLILNGLGEAQCLIQTQSVEIRPFEQVTAEFAATEGEGDGSLEYWRRAHISFFERELKGTGIHFDPAMPVVCEIFKRVY
jgi:uncharacterized protein YhfF/ribosomal protein S18 acetylase RimI-like enzyme